MEKLLISLAESIADTVVYGERQEQNAVAEGEQWHCFIDEIAEGNGTTAGASHSVSYRTSWAFAYPVDLEAPSLDKFDAMTEARAKCIALLNAVIKSGQFDGVSTWFLERVREGEYDINCTGWRLTVELTPLTPYGVCHVTA